MDIQLSSEHRDLSARSRAFCEQVLQPHELSVEENGGLSEALRPELRKAVCDWGFAGINHSVEDGGEGYSIFEQMLINEQLGRATCGLWAVVWQPAISLRFASEAQKEQYLRPSCRGERRGCFAITEPEAGSDPRRVRTEAVRDGDDYVISGEKWFVTSYNACDYIIVHAHVDVDDVLARLPRIRAATRMPLGVGFGIRDAESARKISRGADAVVIASSLIQELEAVPPAQAVERARAFVKPIREAMDA